MPITDSELQALTDHILDLEAQVDFLLRERLLYREGPKALTATPTTHDPVRPRGNAGQPLLTAEELYAVLAGRTTYAEIIDD